MNEKIEISTKKENNYLDCSFIIPKLFWFKYYTDRMKYHYAIIHKKYGFHTIYFINQDGQIFDRLKYKNYKVAKRLLRKNKFICSSNKKCSIMPKMPLYMKLMFGKKTAPYSKGNLWLIQERYKNPNIDDNWKNYPKWAMDTWYSWNKYYQNISLKSFYNLIKDANKVRYSKLEITGKRIYNKDIKLTLKSKFGESEIWLASSMNYISDIWKFLEAVIRSKEPRIYYYCDEEGTDTFFYVKKYQNELLHFIHISNNNTREWKVLQKIKLPMDMFVYCFYKAINQAIRNGKHVSENETDFITLIKGSTIVKSYLLGLS